MKRDFGLLILLRRGVYMSHTNIEEGILSSPPEVPSLDIQTGSWVSYCRVVGECLTSNGCQMWFLFYIRPSGRFYITFSIFTLNLDTFSEVNAIELGSKAWLGGTSSTSSTTTRIELLPCNCICSIPCLICWTVVLNFLFSLSLYIYIFTFIACPI